MNRKQASFTERYNLAQELQALCFACVMNSKSSRRNVDAIEKEEKKKKGTRTVISKVNVKQRCGCCIGKTFVLQHI